MKSDRWEGHHTVLTESILATSLCKKALGLLQFSAFFNTQAQEQSLVTVSEALGKHGKVGLPSFLCYINRSSGQGPSSVTPKSTLSKSV